LAFQSEKDSLNGNNFDMFQLQAISEVSETKLCDVVNYLCSFQVLN